MRQSRFTEAQIIGMIKEQEAGMPTAEVCRRHGLSPASFYKFKAKYGAEALAGGYDARQRCAEGFAGKELTTPSVRRAAARKAMRDHDISQRRACRLVGVDPKTVRRDQPPDNPEVREEMKAIASKRRRFGYRRIGVLLERKGMIMNHKKLYRLYTEEKLGVRRRRGRKRARGSRTPMPVALRPGERWSLDFVSDTFGASRKFRMLAVNDDCCRENLCLMADRGLMPEGAE